MADTSDTPHGTGTGGAFGFVRRGYDRAAPHNLTVADIENAPVYGRDDETIGKIHALKVDAEGTITAAVVEVGGFLGIGAHPVLLPFSELHVLRQTDGTDLRVHLDTTKEQLEAMPPYTG